MPEIRSREELINAVAAAGEAARAEYPATSIEVTSDTMLFKLGVIAALRAFKERRTGSLSTEERFAAMQELIAELARIYEIPAPTLAMENIDGSHSWESSYNPAAHTITMRGRLSIITLLHEFAHARGMNEYGAVGWSVSLFKRVYPERYAQLHQQDHVLTAEAPPEPAPAVQSQPVKVVVCIEGGVVTDVVCNSPIEVRIIDADIDGQEEEDLIQLASDEPQQDYYVYTGHREGNLNTEYVDEVFATIAEKERMFRNFYRCVCGHEWQDEWSAMCDDECPQCGATISPYRSEDI